VTLISLVFCQRIENRQCQGIRSKDVESQLSIEAIESRQPLETNITDENPGFLSYDSLKYSPLLTQSQ